MDRAKDLIIVSGFNVFPAEVEEVLADHPAVAEGVVERVLIDDPAPRGIDEVRARLHQAQFARADHGACALAQTVV